MVFVIVYALFIFIDLAVAKASNVRPSQHQCLAASACAWMHHSLHPRSLSHPPRPLLTDAGALAPAPPVPCPTCAHRCRVCLSPLAPPLPPLHTHPRAPGLDAWLTARSGTPLSRPEHAANA